MYSIFEQLLQKFGITAYKVSKATGVTQASLSKWKSGKSTPSSETLQKIANYFGVTVDYLMTGEEPEEKAPFLTTKDERDISKKLNDTLAQLESTDGLMFDGEALDEETKELLKISLESAIRTAKITAKKKFTPKKYK
ncbi:phage transcriptional regulator, Cro/CI family [Lachnospiraceae bacterium KM106-2]|nr:phage transcriptional regulator, Cro/CI family [Lachnospiraceae bacterium KM106-2]